MTGEAENLDGMDIIAQNMAALESGEELPFTGEIVESSEVVEEAAEEATDDVTEEAANDIDNSDVVEEAAEETPEKILGHQTKEQWVESGKDPDDYLTKEEFDRVGKLKDGNSIVDVAKSQVRTEALLKDLLKQQESMLSKARTDEREKLLAELNAEKEEAINFRETEKALEIDEKIRQEEAKAEPEPEQKPEQDNNLDPSLKEWYDNKPEWYNNHPSATDYLNYQLNIGHQKSLSFDDAIGPATEKVKQKFPELFDDEPALKKEVKKEKPLVRPRAPSEKSARKSPVTSNKPKTFNDAPPEVRPFLKQAAKAASMTESEYMEIYEA
jgi:hypothetical protein